MTEVRNRRQAGFTLLELLVAMSVGLLVAMAVYDLLVWSSKAYKSQNDMVTAQSTGRGVIDVISNDLRHAGLSPLGAWFLAVPEGNASRIRLLSDLNGDTVVASPTQANETISYQFVGPAGDGTYTLMRGIDLNANWDFQGTNETIDTIATRVVAIDSNSDGTVDPFFSYANAPPATSRVTVTFGIRSQYRDPNKKAYVVMNFQDSVALRNTR